MIHAVVTTAVRTMNRVLLTSASALEFAWIFIFLQLYKGADKFISAAVVLAEALAVT